MEVLSPDLLWIDDRCYRLPMVESLNVAKENYDFDRNEFNTESINDYESKCYTEDNEDDECDDDNTESLIESLPDNRYKLSLPIPQAFWSKIIGAKGVTKKRIESDTKTIIHIPRQMEHGDVVIKGSSKRGIILAKKNIDAIVSSARQKLTFTHFISIPMNEDEIKNNFCVFKDAVLKLFGTDRGVDESIFQNPNKLHLTLGTLVLTDQTERLLAEKVLNEVYEKTIKSIICKDEKKLIEMKGIEYMNDDPQEVDVLYGKISGGQEILQKVAVSILGHFGSNKLLKMDSTDNVKLHVTLMNTLFRDEELEEVNEEIVNFNRNKGNKKIRRTFNAANILEKFQDFNFGCTELKTIQLSVRFSTGKDGYYKSSCILNL